MFDNTKIQFSIPANAQLQNLVNNGGAYDNEGRSHRYYCWNGLKVSISEDARGVHKIKGSLHKTYNHCFVRLKDANYTDFTFAQLILIIDKICTEICINPFTASTIHGIEFGVNIETTIPASNIIENLLYMGKAAPRKCIEDETIYFTSVTTNQQHFRLKFYDKGTHQNAGKYLLRVELHIKRMTFLQNRNIHINVLADLLRPDIHTQLGELLLQYVDELVFSPALFNLPIYRKDKKKVIDLFSDRAALKKLRKTNLRQFKIMLNKYREILELSAEDNFQRSLKNTILVKWQYISKLDENACTILTSLVNKYRHNSMYDFNHIIILLNSYIETQHNIIPLNTKSVCVSCGKNISHQRPGSLFCSEWRLGKEGKKCKNKDSNPRNNAKKSIQIRLAQPPGLFPVLETIRPEILRHAQMA